MPERLEPQTFVKATHLVLANDAITMSIVYNRTGIMMPMTAMPLPTILPALKPICTRLIIPRMRAKAAVNIKGMTKVLMPSIATRIKANAQRIRMPSISDTIASLLVLISTDSAVVGSCVNSEPQEVHTWTSSGFWVPHSGQFIFYLLILSL
jgi:hypothetical protein